MRKSIQWPFNRLPGFSMDRQFVSSDGVYLVDSEGRRVLDAAGGAIVANVGYGRRRVAEAVRKATEETPYIVATWPTPGRISLLERLRNDWISDDLSRVHFTSGGSESVEAALGIALKYHYAMGSPTRRKVVSRTISYHGATLWASQISGHPGRKRGLDHVLPPNPAISTPYPLRRPEMTTDDYLDEFRLLIEQEGADSIAALIVEPVTGASGGGLTPPSPDYWPRIQALCATHGILLIADEVMTAFGRTGVRFAYQAWGLEPDILVTGKGLAGGYAPIGAVFAREEIGRALDDQSVPVMFHTFGGHPAACAAAAEVLAILEEEDLVERADEAGRYLRSALAERFAEHPHVAEVRGRGLLIGVELVEDRSTLRRFSRDVGMTGRVVGEGLSRGVFLYPGGTGEVRDVVCLGPALTISRSEMDEIVDVLAASIEAATVGLDRR